MSGSSKARWNAIDSPPSSTNTRRDLDRIVAGEDVGWQWLLLRARHDLTC